MSAHRWERERAAWLHAHSSDHGGQRHQAMRRNAEILDRAGRRGRRAGSGIGATAVADEIRPGLWYRLTHDNDGSRRRRFVWAVLAAFAAVAGGVGYLVGRLVYRALERRSPTIGRLRWWPWAAGAAAMVAARVAGTLLLDWPWLGVRLHFDRHFPLTLADFGGWLAWVQLQLVVAPATVAVLIVVWGWAGVPKGAVGPPVKNPDGSFYVTPDADKDDLDPWKGTERTASAAAHDPWFDEDDITDEHESDEDRPVPPEEDPAEPEDHDSHDDDINEEN